MNKARWRAPRAWAISWIAAAGACAGIGCAPPEVGDIESERHGVCVSGHECVHAECASFGAMLEDLGCAPADDATWPACQSKGATCPSCPDTDDCLMEAGIEVGFEAYCDEAAPVDPELCQQCAAQVAACEADDQACRDDYDAWSAEQDAISAELTACAIGCEEPRTRDECTSNTAGDPGWCDEVQRAQHRGVAQAERCIAGDMFACAWDCAADFYDPDANG